MEILDRKLGQITEYTVKDISKQNLEDLEDLLIMLVKITQEELDRRT